MTSTKQLIARECDNCFRWTERGSFLPSRTETGRLTGATTTSAMCANVKRKTIGSFARHWNDTRKASGLAQGLNDT